MITNMEFTREYWILESSLICANESIPGGLKCFGPKHISEPCIIALKEDLKEICKGIKHNFSESEKSEWSAKMTNMFSWKWLLSHREFHFLKSLCSCNFNRFKDVNFNLCYEVIKSNNWAYHFCEFLQSFNIGTYTDLLKCFLNGILAEEGFQFGREDVRFVVDLIYCTLNSLLIRLKEVEGDVLRQQQIGKSIECFLKIMIKIFQSPDIVCDVELNLKFLCITSFLNCLCALTLDSILSVSSIDGVRPKMLTPGRDGNSEILTYEIGLLNFDYNSKLQGDIPMSSYVQSFLASSSAFCETALDQFGKVNASSAENFSGYSHLDVCSDLLVTAVNHLRDRSTSEDISRELRADLSSVAETLSPMIGQVSEAIESKRLASRRDEFKAKVALSLLEAKSGDCREHFRLLLQLQIDSVELNLRKVKCLGGNVDLIDDIDVFFEVLHFMTHLQNNLDITSGNEDIIRDLKNALVKAYSQFPWSIRDELVVRLNESKWQKIAILDDTSELKARWKPCLNRLSNADQGVTNEMSSIISLLFLDDVESVFADIFSEVAGNSRIVKVVARILCRFPKTLTHPSKESEVLSAFYSSFLSVHCETKDPKKNLSALIQSILLGDLDVDRKSAPLLDFENFSVVCVHPTTMKGFAADLRLVELYLEIARKSSAQLSVGVEFVFLSVLALLCSLLDGLHGGSFPFPPSDCSTGDEFSFKWKDMLNRMISSWKEVFQLLFSDDPTFKEFLCSTLKEFQWWTQNHFLDCLLEANEPVLPPTLQKIMLLSSDEDSSVPGEDLDVAESIKDLIDFIGISQFCFDYSKMHFNTKQVILCKGNALYDIFVRIVCQKFRLSTHSEWLRTCYFLMELVPSNVESSESNNVLAVCHLLCDCLFLIKILQKKTENDPVWTGLSWEKLCQYLKSFIKTFVKEDDHQSDARREISLSVCRLSAIIPAEPLAEVIELLLENTK